MARGALGALVVSLGLDAGEFTSGLTKSEYQAKKSLDAMKANFSSVGNTIKGVFGGLELSRALHAVFDELEHIKTATIESERSFAQLNAVLKITGNSAGFTATRLAGIGKEIEGASIFDDDAIRAATTALLRFRQIQGDVFEDAIKLAPDVATALGTDLTGAVQALGRALTEEGTGGMKALKAAGMSLSDQNIDLAARMSEAGNKAGAMKLKLDELRKSVGGAAGADNEGLYGATERLKRSWGDLEKTVGKKLFADNRATVESMTGLLDRLNKKAEESSFSWKHFADTMLRLGAAAFGVNIKGPQEPNLASGKITTPEGIPTEQLAAEEAARQQKLSAREDAEYDKLKISLQKRAATAAQFYNNEATQQKVALDIESDQLEGAYARNEVTIEQYYARRINIAKRARMIEDIALGKQGEAQEAILRSPAFDTAAKDSARLALVNIALQSGTKTLELGRNQVANDIAQRAAIRALSVEYNQLAVAVAEANGELAKAAVQGFDVAHRDQVEKLQTISKFGNEDAATRARDALADIAMLRQRADTIGQLAEKQRDYALVVDQIGIAQAKIDLQQQTGNLTEIEAITKKAALAESYIASLRQQVAVQEEIAKTLSGPEQAAALLKIEQMKLAIDQLAASSDVLAKKFNDIFAGSVADALASVVDGTKSVKDAFKDMEKSIVSAITRIAAQNLAETLFKPENFGGIGKFLAGLFGGKSSTEATGAAALTTAGTTLTSAGALLTTAAAALTGAAAALGMSGISSAAMAGIPGLGSAGTFGGGFFNPFEGMIGYAGGTSSARGGWSMVGERGPEMVRLPRGAQVIPNDVLMGKRAMRQTVNITVAGGVTSKTADQIAVQVGRATRRAIERNA